MTSTSSSKNDNENARVEMGTDWAKNAENAAKKAEAEVDKLKKEAQEQLSKGRGIFNNPDDK